MTHRLRYCLYLITFCLASSISVSAQFSEEDLEKQANDLFASEKYAEAMPLYSQLLSLNPTKPEYNYKYGATALYGDADKKEEAIKFLKFASKQSDIDNKCWYFLGKAYHLNYQFADAVSAYEQFSLNASSKEKEELHISREIESARSGQNLLSNIKEVKVLEKKLTAYESFFRAYELSDIGGKILVTPDELLSPVDKKKNHKSLIHFRGTGTTVYFSSYGKDEKNGLDIYKAEVLPGGTFSDPVRLGGFVNTKFDEDFPFMHPDNKTFYFSSTGHSSMGGYDIFRAYYDQGLDVFSQPENLDFAINTPDDELFYIADTAQKMANFASARSSKQGELHVYRVLVQSNPLELTFVKGTFINRVDESEKLAKVSVLDASSNKLLSEQYTNPDNGDYVVSVPRSGKFKFVVEVQGSDKVHAGLVDIPKSAGIQAYIQEMELVLSAGVEKLLINNKFDQTYDGDVLALAKDLLRKQAELDVNFDLATETIPDTPVLEEENFALAYKVAGFPAGFSNEKVVEDAKQRTLNIQDELARNEGIKALAIKEYLDKSTSANIKILEAQEITKSAKLAEGPDKSELMFNAALIKSEATAMLNEAQSAYDLVLAIEEIQDQNKEALENSQALSESLNNALESEDYSLMLDLLKEELAIQNGEVEDALPMNARDEVLQASLDAKNSADRLMQRSTSLREEADEVSAQLLTKRRQREKANGKLANQLDEEIAILEKELSDIEASITSSFEKASKSQVEASNKEQQYDLFIAYTEAEEQLDDSEKSTLLGTSIAGDELNSYRDRIESIEIDPSLVAAYAAENPEEFNAFDPELRNELAATYFDTDQTKDAIADESVLADNSDITNEEVLENNTAENNLPEKDNEEPEFVSKDEDISIGDANTSEDLTANISRDVPENISYQEARNLIAAEQIKVKAASDWLLVIDASIADLESGMGGEDDDEIQEQLNEYETLKSQKQVEIANSEAYIAQLSLVDDKSAEFPEVLQRAEQDLETLSSAQVADLEAKSQIASVDQEYIQTINSIDSDYLPELTAIELSGKSSPEIATERIELNKALLSSLDVLIEEEATTDIPQDDLIELRRIKLLELKQDEEISLGSMVYSPRTAEAKEYVELVSEQENDIVSADLSSLSPQIQKDLSTDYTRTQINPDYDREIAVLESSSNDSVALARRIELNKAFLRELQAEIDFYSQTIKSQEEDVPSPLSERYNELLADRSKLADEIQEDQIAIQELAMQEASLIANSINADQEISDLENSYTSELELIQAQEYSEAELMKAKAQLNFVQAEKADSLVLSYMDELDIAESDEERDQIQIAIQKLDAVAADKKQEADRLMYEADVLASAATEADIVPDQTMLQEGVDTDTYTPADFSSSPSYADLRYKSLNANISYSKLESSIDSAKSVRADLQVMGEAYKAETDDAVKKEMVREILAKEAELSSLEEDLIKEIALSNAAEIEYYQKSNAQLLQNIESNYAQDADLTEYSERTAEISEMLSKNELQKTQNEISESEHLANEIALISSLADLNQDMDVFIEDKSESTPNSDYASLDSVQLSPYELLMRNPDNHIPEEGATYMNPIYAQVNATLGDSEKDELIQSTPGLEGSTSFVVTPTEVGQEELLSSATKIDTRGFDLLKSDPEKLQYVLSSVKADSLKTLESESASLAESRSQSSNEKFSEAARLRNMVVHEELESNKAIVRRRAETLEEEAEKDLEVAAIAAENAEKYRSERVGQERELAEYAQKLQPSELNELNALLRNETYTIVPDMDTPTAEVSEAEEPTVGSAIKNESTTEYSSDELALYNSTGNWLGVVEIIGEKDDFSDVKESLFLESDESPYSNEKPIPIDPIMPDGLIFQVQVGAFRNPIPQDLYKEFAPVMGQKLDNGITRYRAGIFRVYEEARETRDLIRTKGYQDAFVVVYMDGERLSASEAQSIFAQSSVKNNDEIVESTSSETPVNESMDMGVDSASEELTSETDSSQEKSSVDYYNDPTAAEAVQVEITTGLFYTVQVGVYSKPVQLDKLFELTELNSELTASGYIRYTTGRFSNLNEARTRKNSAINSGVGDAFITAYYNGERISVQEAASILSSEGPDVLYNEGLTETDEPENEIPLESSNESESIIQYIVIMGMAEGDVPQELANLFLENEDWNIQRMAGPSGQELYISPKFDTIEEANEFLGVIRASGVESAILGKMVNGSITEVNIQN